MTQNSFEFFDNADSHARNTQKEMQEEIARHNRNVIAQAIAPVPPSGSLVTGLDNVATKLNAVYILRGILARQMQRGMTSPQAGDSRKKFIKSLKAEIKIKKSGQDVAVTVRNALIHNSNLL
jgi:hypothetical protein